MSKAKQLKLRMTIGVIALLIGVTICIVIMATIESGAASVLQKVVLAAGLVLFFGGCGVYGFARFMAWWTHE